MPNDFFEFKKFRIKHDKCAMRVNTDAVLLGAWVATDKCRTILDIGTGSGVIALMLAQKSEARITAIDIDKASAEQAAENVSQSPYSDRVQVKHCSLQDFVKTNDQQFSLVVTNPPYFLDSFKNSSDARAIARHADALSFDDLIAGVKKVLHDRGKFCVILPKNEAQTFREKADAAGLYLSKLLRVRTTQEKNSEKRHLMQFEFRESEFSESTLIIEADSQHQYTPEYRALTRDFYINF